MGIGTVCGFPRFCLTQELYIQTNSPHEQVDIAQPLAGHIGRQGLAVAHGLHDTVPESKLVSKMAIYLIDSRGSKKLT